MKKIELEGGENMDDRQLKVLLEDAFDGVRCEQNLKDKTLDNIINGKATNRQRMFANVSPNFSPLTRGLAAVMCCVVAVLATFGVYSTPAAAICLDGDMSMRLVVNRFDRVIDVTAYNDTAKNALDQLDTKVKGAVGKQVIKDVMETDTASDVEVYIISDNEKLSGAILSDVTTSQPEYTAIASNNKSEAYRASSGVLCQVVPGKANDDKNAVADKNGMTYQRYEIFQKIQALGIGLTEEQVRNMNIGELRAIVAKAELNVGNGTIDGEYNEGVLEDVIPDSGVEDIQPDMPDGDINADDDNHDGILSEEQDSSNDSFNDSSNDGVFDNAEDDTQCSDIVELDGMAIDQVS